MKRPPHHRRRISRIASALAVSCLACQAATAPASEWRLARSSHFELYFQSAEADARAAVLWLEQLRALALQHTGLTLDRRPPVRVLAFRDTAAYDPYRVRASSDAYYVGSENRDYIVMAGIGSPEHGVAAHEYAHALLRESASGLPLWLREGVAEVFSTVRISPRGATIGGDLPQRLQTFRQERPLPLPELLARRHGHHRDDRAAMFYAQSWALADMVLLAHDYAPRFREFAAQFAQGDTSQQAFERVYAKTLGDVEADLKLRSRHKRIPIVLPATLPSAVPIEIAAAPELRVRTLLAEVVLLAGDLDYAGGLYRQLEREAPDDPDIALGLGALALRLGNANSAREHWKRAIQAGAADPILCLRYAALASLAGVPPEEIRPVLQRAIELKPDLDDARYSLALLEANAGHHEIAVTQLRAMRTVAPARAFSYWTALADALTQLGDRAGAQDAARKAMSLAATDEERHRANSLLHIAETDFAVRMARDAEGRPHMVATRIPHDSTDFNPFIEPGDAIERIDGNLREVTCGEVLRLVVASSSGDIALSIRGLDRVLIRNGPAEFTCGPQSNGAPVTVEYAKSQTGGETAGEVRGLTFH